MKKIKFLSLALALLMILTTFAGCGKDEEKADGNSENNSQTDAATSSQLDGTDSTGDDTAQDTVDGVKKIGSIDHIVTPGNSGVYYRGEDQKYGIMSLDGKKDTGTKYATCEPLGDYFAVALTKDLNPDDIDSINNTGVVDVNGNVIVPMEYAIVEKFGDRYAQAMQVTKQTTDKDNYLIRLSSSLFTLVEQEGDIFFEGVWYIYDLTTGKKVEGVSGTDSYTPNLNGSVITFRNEQNERISVNAKGEKIPADAKLFTNGYYTIEGTDSGTLYDCDGNKIFDYSLDGFKPTNSDNDKYLSAMKTDDSGNTKRALMDYTGKIVSAEFDKSFSVYGDLILCEEKLYKLDGTPIIDDTVTSVYLEKHYKNAYFLKNGKNYTLIKDDGTVLYKGVEDDTTSFDVYSTFTFYKKSDNKHMYYSFADNDFTIEGSSLVPWLVKAKNANKYDVVDTLTGETLISGYNGYYYVVVPDSYIYIYALTQDSTIDIYVVN